MTWMSGFGEVLAVADAAVADDVRVHAGAAERFADRVDDQHVDVIERQAREVMAVALHQLRLALQNVGRPDGVQLGRLVEAVFENRQAGPNLARVEHDLAHLEQHLLHLRRGRRVKRRGRGVLPMPTTIIFVSPLCTGPAKHVCSLMRLSTSTPADS